MQSSPSPAAKQPHSIRSEFYHSAARGWQRDPA